MALARLSAVLAGILTVFSLVPVVYAQFDSPIASTDLTIGLTPQYPRPGEAVQLTAQVRGVDLAGSTFVWRADGTIIAQGVGVSSAPVTAGALGSETAVEMDMETPQGTVRSAQATVAPTEIDLLVNADSYTPPFYRGRALPSIGTNVVAQALTRFVRADGSLIPDSDIIYTWKHGGQVLGALSGRGRSSAVIPVRHLYTNDTVTVDAVSSDLTRSGEVSVFVPSVKSVLDLYEDHPLFGILFNNALRTSASIPETEMAFAAIPYFAQATGPNDAALSYAWRVNDTPVPASVGTPSEITINADNSNGQAQVALEVTHTTNPYMDALGLWNITLSSRGAPQDPFRSTAQ